MTPHLFRLALLTALLPACSGGAGPTSDSGSGAMCAVSVPVETVGAGGALVPSGLERCTDDNVVHSVSAESFPSTPPGECGATPEYASCLSDAECTDAPNGQCMNDNVCSCGCYYGCLSDADCGTDEYCDTMSRGRCMPMGCRTDADCDNGQLCRWAYDGRPGNPPFDYTLQCTTDADTCVVKLLDYSYDPLLGGDDDTYCAWTGERFQMVNHMRYTDCGRPLCDPTGRARTASPRSGDSWSSQAPSAPAHEVAAAYFVQVGLLEHASVASFLRAGMELMMLGAPPELVDETLQAARDEVRHAQQAFALARRFGAHAEPGPLDAPMAPRSDRETIVRGLVVEACVGETIAALQVADDAARAGDAVVRSTLEAIAEDESRHALLGWRTLRWLLEAHPELRPAAASAFDEALGDRPPSAVVGHPDLGVPSGAHQDLMRRRAIAEAIEPGRAALLA